MDSQTKKSRLRTPSMAPLLYPGLLLTALLLTFSVGACQLTGSEAGASESADSREIDSDKARELVANGAMLVDVRTPEEYEERHLEGAVNLPLADLEEWRDDLPDKPIVLYCRSGNRSGQALEQLVEKGHDEVYNVGGIDDY